MTERNTSIGIAYMIISPVITGFAVAAFALSYIIYKYLYTWVVSNQDGLQERAPS